MWIPLLILHNTVLDDYNMYSTISSSLTPEFK